MWRFAGFRHLRVALGVPLVWIIAGEASGDLAGGLLARELRKLIPGVRIEAVGGSRLAGAADELLYDSSNWGAIGIARSLPKVPPLWLAYRRLVARAAAQPPDLVIAIDFGYFNIRLLRRLRPLGCKVLYYMPPGSWRKDRQGSDLPDLTDAIATPFEWSADLLNSMGAQASWVGHPLLDLMSVPLPGPREARVVVMPGSRDHEIRSNLPVIAAAISLLKGYTVSAALTPFADQDEARRLWGGPLDIQVGHNAELLSAARGAVICSGTATLEAVVADCPLVVVYRGDSIMNLEFRIRRPQFDFIALPSILLGRSVCEELIQDATPERIASALSPLLKDDPARQRQLSDFAEVRERMGTPGASRRTAEIATELLSS